MATTNAPSYASPQTAGTVRRSQHLSDAIRQMQSGRTADSYRTNTATFANILSDAVLGYARNNAETKADTALAADKTRLSDMIRGQFPDQQGIANQQLGSDQAFDLTPQGNQQRQDQGKIGNLASMLFETSGDPTAAIQFGLGQQRQGIEDQRYADQQKYDRNRDTREDFVADRAFGESISQFYANFDQSAKQFDATSGMTQQQIDEAARHNRATEGLSAMELAAKAAAGSAPKPEDVGALRKEWNAQAGDFRGVRDAYSRVQASADGATPAQQMSLIFAYMKMLDPTSAVRETEYANAENARGVPVAIQNVWNKLKDGQFLAPSQITDFKNQATALYANAEKDYTRSYDFYRGQAQQSGMAPDIIQDFRAADEEPQPERAKTSTISAPGGQEFSRDEAEAVRNFMSTLPENLQDPGFIAQLDMALGAGAEASPQAAAPVTVSSPADLAALPKGTQYRAPDGTIWIK